MKKVTPACIVLLLFFAGCTSNPLYPELEASISDSLRRTSIENVFVASLTSSKPRPANDTSFRCVKRCATKTIYWVQVTYPVTVCFPPDIIVNGSNAVFAKSAGGDSIHSLITSERPVTTMISKRSLFGYNRLFCKTYGGPWIAEITDEEQCDNSCGEGSHRFTLKILGVQETLVWTWWGSMAGRPQEVHFIGEPWIRNQATIDCNLSDLTNCTGTGTGDGGHPAIQ